MARESGRCDGESRQMDVSLTGEQRCHVGWRGKIDVSFDGEERWISLLVDLDGEGRSWLSHWTVREEMNLSFGDVGKEVIVKALLELWIFIFCFEACSILPTADHKMLLGLHG